MKLLALDVGSSSIKAAVLKNGRIRGAIARASFPTRYDGVRAEVEPKDVLKAVADAIAQVGAAARKVEVIGLTVMAPSWVAMDHKGRPLMPIITHQDRRSVATARELEQRVGKARHLRLAGNRPFPGGISSTTWAHFNQHEKSLMKKVDLAGHLNTYLHRVMTHSRVTDPSNASFMGLYKTLDQSGWSDELLEAAGVGEHPLPQLLGAEEIGGLITREGERRFGLTHGTPMLVGCIDGSAAMLLAGNRPGQLVNVVGSTDVLALCTDKPRPHENLLTRAVGVGERWVSVSTIAAAGSALDWAHKTFFRDLSVQQFRRLMLELADRREARRDARREGGVIFDNYLAGSRTSLEQTRGAITGLTLSTTREEILAGLVESLARSSAERLGLLRSVNSTIRMRCEILMTGGVSDGLNKILHRDWGDRWTFKVEQEATLRGLAKIVPQD